MSTSQMNVWLSGAAKRYIWNGIVASQVRRIIYCNRASNTFDWHRQLLIKENHDDVIKRKHFPRYWPFVRGIHRSRWFPRTKASDAEVWSARLSKHSWGWWFEAPSRSLWRHCNNVPFRQRCIPGWQRISRVTAWSGHFIIAFSFWDTWWRHQMETFFV